MDQQPAEMEEVYSRLAREKEEEKRRLQVEMRKREQELLDKIKEQQRQLEFMKVEKTKVRRRCPICRRR